jgi:signal transduction histidine kinase
MLKDSSKEFATSKFLAGYNTPYSYQAKFSNIFGFIVQKMGWQISGSFLLLAFVVISFVSLYRNLLAQRRLADMKNEFISNITHELKTPIATVSVAIEALKNFGGISSPERTKEYLDISSSELQRLSLLVDKVLKLSMFENREIELKKEPLDLRNLIDEVLNTMKLQFEKHQVIVQLKTEGTNFMIHADRLHIVSVLYNLLDNAMKYSKDKPSISIELSQLSNEVSFAVTDKGIGIPAEYKEKVFEKFFRVPTGNKHNVKGYGLGLSYVYHVVAKHNGSIQVESEEGNGSTFTVKLPS